MTKKVLYSVIGVVVLAIIVLIVNSSNGSQPAAQVQQNTTVQPAATTLSPEAVKQKVAVLLSASTDHYVTLLSTGKAAQGTTQYSAAEATAALNDPNSSPAKISAFRNSTCLQSDPSVDLTDTYRNASNLYYDAHLDSAAIDDWYADMSDASSNICIWAADAVSWEIKGISTAKLSVDEATVAKDIAKARVDIQALTK